MSNSEFRQRTGEDTANADLNRECIFLKARQQEVSLKILPYHKYPELPKTHEIAHQAMRELSNGKIK